MELFDEGNAPIQWPLLLAEDVFEVKQKVMLADQLTEQRGACEVKPRS